MRASASPVANRRFGKPLGFGLGLRSPHYSHILENRPRGVEWFEAITENYIGIETQEGIASGGRPLEILKEIRQDYPIVLHGVGLSIGSTDPLNESYLDRLKELARIIEPEWISDHCCWTGVQGHNLHDLLPLPFTEEALEHVVTRVTRVQERLGRRILLENVSSYFCFSSSRLSECEFISELAEQADCGILLDVNNVHVSARNHGFDPKQYISRLPRERIGQIHIAGHSSSGEMLIDTHDHEVCDEVWALYRQALSRFGTVPTLLEWDAKIPDFPTLENELNKARRASQENPG